MEQFSLEKYLENTRRKVVTRRGNPVRIICTDRKHGEDDLPIVFLEEINGGEMLLTCKSDGRSDNNYDTQYDLFFADDGEELTEFDYAVLSIISDHNSHTDSIEAFAKRSSKKLLDLARKEICLTCKEYSRGYKEGLKLGREDILKDLPKWRKNPSREKRQCMECQKFLIFITKDISFI